MIRGTQAKPQFLTIIIAEYQFAIFQMRGFPHSHALIWTSDCPILTSENRQAIQCLYTEYIDSMFKLFFQTRILNHSSLSLLECIKSILTFEHAGNTEIYYDYANSIFWSVFPGGGGTPILDLTGMLVVIFRG